MMARLPSDLSDDLFYIRLRLQIRTRNLAAVHSTTQKKLNTDIEELFDSVNDILVAAKEGRTAAKKEYCNHYPWFLGRGMFDREAQRYRKAHVSPWKPVIVDAKQLMQRIHIYK